MHLLKLKTVKWLCYLEVAETRDLFYNIPTLEKEGKMLFWKKRKKFDDKQLEQIVDEYLGLMKETIEGCLPRNLRRALRRMKEWRDFSRVNKEEEIEQIRKNGLENWLATTMQEAYEELAPFVSQSTEMEQKLKKMLKEFKEKWGI